MKPGLGVRMYFFFSLQDNIIIMTTVINISSVKWSRKGVLGGCSVVSLWTKSIILWTLKSLLQYKSKGVPPGENHKLTAHISYILKFPIQG